MKFLYVFISFALILGACSPATAPAVLPTVSPSAIIIPSATTTSSATDIPKTPTLFPAETATISPSKTPGPISSIPSCTNMEAQNVLPADYHASGVMLSLDRPSYSSLSGSAPYQKSGLYFFDFSNRVENFFISLDDYQEQFKTKIIRLGVEDLSVSPDFLKAIYLVDVYVDSDWEFSKSWLEIYNAGTGERKRIFWKEEWEYIIGWVNNEYFAIRSGSSVVVLDLSGNVKKQFLASKYPDYSNPRVYVPSVFVLWGGYRRFDKYSFDSGGGNLASLFGTRDIRRLYNPSLEVYNPSLQYVIYTEVKERKPGIVLYGIEEKQKIIEIITDEKVHPAAFGGMPVWSPGGDNALMLLPMQNNPSRQALFLLNISGQIEQLTTFEVLGPYSWSPDGNFVAFWLSHGRQIGILDMKNKSLQIFCINGGYANGGSYITDGITASGDLVWLPNNNQILVEIFKVSGATQYEGIGIADLEKNILIELKWNVRYPIWLEK